MPRIHTITTDTTMNDADMVLGTDGATGANNATKNYTFSAMKAHFLTNPSVTGNLTVAGNTSIGGNLAVTGTSTFTGTATFNGDINFGDADTDNLYFNADVKSHIIPDADNEFDLGSPAKQWRNLYVTGTTELDDANIRGAVQIDGTLTVGVDDTGYDVKFFGDTASKYLLWDASEDTLYATGEIDAKSLDISGDIDVDGTSDLSVVNIGGTLQVTGVTAFGVDDTGVDVKLYGATAGRFLHWDESEDHLLFADNVKAQFGNDEDLAIYHDNNHSYISEQGTGNLIIKSNNKVDFEINGTSYFNIYDGSTNITRPINVVSAGAHISLPDNAKLNVGTGNDLQIYHDSTHSYIKEAGDGDLRIETTGSVVVKAPNDVAADLELWADNGDNHSDYWKLTAQTDNVFEIQTKDGGSWAPVIELSASDKRTYLKGGLYLPGTIQNPAFTIPKTAGTSGQVLKWPSSGTLLEWASEASVTSLVENNSIWLGSNPTSSTNNAEMNVAVGIGALDAITTGDENVAIGYDAAGDCTIGIDRNVLIGRAAGKALLQANNGNGWGAGSGCDNVLIGHMAGDAMTSGSKNVLIGKDAGTAATSMSNSVVIGYDAGGDCAQISDGSIVAIGYEAMKSFVSNSSSSQNTAVGTWAGMNVTNSHNNTLFGYQAGAAITDGDFNTSIGQLAGGGTGDYNVNVGYKAGDDLTAGTLNTLIGAQAGESTTTGNKNTLIGYKAGTAMTVYYENVIIGESAGEALTGGSGGGEHTGSKNVIIGCEAFDQYTTGANNVIIGHGAMSNTGGSSGNNVVIGGGSGGSMGTGSNSNTIIGWGADVGSGGDDNSIAIGKDAEGHGSHIAVIGNTDITAWHPGDDNGVDLGSTSYSFKDSYVQGRSNAGNFKIDALNTAPSSASDTGTVGEIRYTTDYIYICVATNTWKRSAIATW